MALTCTLTATPSTYKVGNSPPPQVSMSVSNATAAAITVTGVRVYTKVGSTVMPLPYGEVSFPTGPGVTTSVPASGSITMGPFAFAMGSGANNSTFQAVLPVGGSQWNPQLAEPTSTTVVVCATVTASDGSVNEASTASITVTPTVA